MLFGVIILVLSSFAGTMAQFCSPTRHVVTIGIDGLGSNVATSPLFPKQAPKIYKLLSSSALNTAARAFKPTLSLPNWSSFMLGTSPSQTGIKHNVPPSSNFVRDECTSLFATASAHGIRTALFSDWPHLYQIVPPDLVEMPIFNGDMSALASEFVDWLNRLRQQERSLSYIHFDAVDKAGHADGFGSTSYYEALRRVDFLVASIIAAAERLDPIIVLLSDHGGEFHDHEIPTPAVVNVPLSIWGRQIRVGPAPSLSSLTDAAATVLQLFNIGQPKHWNGRSAVPELMLCQIPFTPPPVPSGQCRNLSRSSDAHDLLWFACFGLIVGLLHSICVAR